MKIYHISDIHIRNKSHDDVLFAARQLKKKIGEENSPIIIAGDVFESKNTVSQFDLLCFSDFLEILSPNPIIIIPGNHDFHPNKPESDLISAAMIKSSVSNVTVYSKSGVYSHPAIPGASLYVFSPVDNENVISENCSSEVTIGLFHEPIKDSKLYNQVTIDDARFSPETLSERFTVSMLGDIHKYQFLKPNVAYSGSLIQKNKGEDLMHGCIKWEIRDGEANGTFIPLVLKSAFVKVFGIGNKMKLPDASLYESVKHLEFIHKDCSAETVAAMEKKIKSEFGKIHNVINKSEIQIENIPDSPISKEILFQPGVAIGSTTNQVHLLSELLKQHPDKEKVLGLHAEMTQKFSTSDDSNLSPWKLVSLHWSNLYRFQEDNYIDFSQLSGVVSLIGKNKSGKSSIVDVLLFILYNKINRGTLRNIINCHKNEYSVVCTLKIGESYYSITRIGGAHASAQTRSVRFCKMQSKSGEISADLSGVDIDDTYKIISSMIGEYSDIVNLNIACQDSTFIVDKTKSGQISDFYKYLGLDKLEKIEQYMTERQKSEKQRLKVLKEKTPSADEAIITRNENPVNSHFYSEKPLSALKKEKDRLNKMIYPGKFGEPEARAAKKKIETIQKSEYFEMIRDSEKYSKKTIGQLRDKIAELQGKIQRVSGEARVEEMTSEIEKLRLEIRESDSEDGDEEIRKNCEVLNSEIRKLKSEISEVKSQIPAKVVERFRNETFIEWIARTKSKFNLVSKSISTANIPQLESRAKKLAAVISVYESKYGQSPPEKYTESGEEIQSSGPEFDEMEYRYKTLRDEVERETGSEARSETGSETGSEVSDPIISEEEKIKLESKIEIHRILGGNEESLIKHIKFAERCECCESNKSYLVSDAEYLADAEEKIRAYNWHQKRRELAELEKRYNAALSAKFRKYEKVKKLLGEIKSEISAAKKSADFEKYHDVMENLGKMKLEYQKKLEEHRILKEKLETISRDENAKREIRDLEKSLAAVKENQKLAAVIRDLKDKLTKCEKIVELQKLLAQSQDTLEKSEVNTRATKKLLKLESEIDEREDELARTEKSKYAARQRAEFLADIEKSEKRIELISLYLKHINRKTGIPYMLLSQSTKSIENEINKILTDVSDFKIEFMFNKSRFKIDTVENGKSIPAVQASGFQKFIIDLSMRLSLTKSHPFLPNFLIVDEGFGRMDDEHLGNAKDFLQNLSVKKEYTWLLIVSHIEELHNAADTKLSIEVRTDEDGNDVSSIREPEISDAVREFVKKCKANAVKQAIEVRRDTVASMKKIDGGEVSDEAVVIRNSEGRLYCRVCEKTVRGVESHLRTKVHKDGLAKKGMV